MSKHAVVIGAGLGGLAAALRLGKKGYRITLVDRLDQLGGRARVHKIDGYTFDAGPTVVTAPFLFEELWQLFDRNLEDDVELVPVSPFYRIRFDDGEIFDYTGSAEKMRAEIERVAPGDADAYERFVEKSREIFDIGFTQLSDVPFGNPLEMAKIIPAMMKLESYRTVYGLVSKYVKSEKLRQVLSFHPLLVGGNPFSTTSIYTLIAFLERKWGVHYAMGGTGALVAGMGKLLDEECDANVRLGEEVSEIIVKGGKAKGVRLKGGEVIDADIVVSNADAAWTLKRLIKPKHRKKWPDWRLERSRYSMSLFVWYFGTNRRYDDCAHHTILLGPRYKELLHDIFERKVLADDFSLYLHRPTASDPTMAPKGHEAFYVLSPVPHLDSGLDWDKKRDMYRDKISMYLEQAMLPDLHRHITVSKTLDPQGFLDDYRSFKGAAFSFEPVLQQSAYFRPHNASEDVKGLYFVGAGTHPGAGMPGVLSSAKVLERLL